jgi:hypothetical protein
MRGISLKGRLSALAPKHLTTAKKLARNRYSSLLGTFVNHGRKKFHNIGPEGRVLDARTTFVAAKQPNLKLPEQLKGSLALYFALSAGLSTCY